MNQRWFTIKARGAAASEIFIFGDIGESWFGESVTAKQFVDELAALDTALPLTIRINSIGGSVIDGLAIYNAIKRHAGHVTVSVEGLAASIGSLIAMAGDVVEMAANARLMVHAPWGSARGNAQLMRQYADELDAWAAAMATSYAAKTGKTTAQVLALLTDGQDHWYSADQALAEGFADRITGAVQLAAALDTSRYQHPAARAANERNSMNDTNTSDVLSRSEKSAEGERRKKIMALFSNPLIEQIEGAGRMKIAMLDDRDCSEDEARERLLVALGANASPANGGFVYTVEDESDKRIKGVTAAIEARAGTGPDDRANNYRSATLVDVARGSLQAAGVRHGPMSQTEIVKAAITHTGSDFPKILEGIANKSMLKGYDEMAETFPRWTAKGSLRDFKVEKRVGLAAFPTLTSVAEGAEFQYATIGEYGESIILGTVGNIFSISRQAIINDDLSAFTKIPQRMGRAAKRAIGDAVYAVLTGNPTMADGVTLFHANHSNIGTAGVISTDSVAEAQAKMALQKGHDGNTVTGIPMAFIIVPMALLGRANVVRNSAFYVGATELSATIPNATQGVFEVIAEPRLDAASSAVWYAAAGQNLADTIEVAYLDGNEVPYLDQQTGWTTDGVEFKVRHDFGVKALDFRGLFKNAGG